MGKLKTFNSSITNEDKVRDSTHSTHDLKYSQG